MKRKMVLTVLFFISSYFLYGALLFWGTRYSEKDNYKDSSLRYDIVVVFSGEEDRIPPAFELIQKGKAKSLIISAATSSEITDIEKKYNNGNSVPYYLETKSTSTHDNAFYCSEIIKRENAHKVILITSNYHMNRSYRLLSLSLKGYPVEISCYTVNPFGIDESTMKRIPYFQMLSRIEHLNMVFNYLKFMFNGTKIRGSNRVDHYLENMYGSVVKRWLSKYDYRKELPLSR